MRDMGHGIGFYVKIGFQAMVAQIFAGMVMLFPDMMARVGRFGGGIGPEMLVVYGLFFIVYLLVYGALLNGFYGWE